ncbi:MAG: GGDEF domain-containing protein [Candidatus Acidiferrales bacterium]
MNKRKHAPTAEEYKARLTNLQRREWSIWTTSLTIMLCLAAGLACLSFSAALRDKNVLDSIAGLTILIVLFGCYSTYEKFVINRLRLEIAQNQASSALWREVALVDPLTGLSNRRYAEKRLKEEILRSHRQHYPLCLVVFDLNEFKQINDRFGHAAGDMVLKAFAESLRHLARETDVAARLGGDEFALLLTECDSVQAESIIERLKPDDVNIESHSVPIRFAFGCKQYRVGEQAGDMMSAADEALYEHKRKSKKTVLTPAK